MSGHFSSFDLKMSDVRHALISLQRTKMLDPKHVNYSECPLYTVEPLYKGQQSFILGMVQNKARDTLKEDKPLDENKMSASRDGELSY